MKAIISTPEEIVYRFGSRSTMMLLAGARVSDLFDFRLPVYINKIKATVRHGACCLEEGITVKRDLLLLSFLQGHKFTANETIGTIYRRDVQNGIARMDWKFYLHLNKRFAPLSRKGMIEQVGTKVGPSSRLEKVWGLTAVGESFIEDEQALAA